MFLLKTKKINIRCKEGFVQASQNFQNLISQIAIYVVFRLEFSNFVFKLPIGNGNFIQYLTHFKEKNVINS